MAQVVGGAVRAVPAAGRSQDAPLAHTAGSPRLALILGIYLMVALLSMLYVSQTSLVASFGYQVGDLEAARIHWKLMNDQLGLQIAEARSLATIEREARRLGMGPPERVVYLRATPSALPAVEPGHPERSESTWVDDVLERLRGPW
jgi:Zn-dependent protease with chaperone function